MTCPKCGSNNVQVQTFQEQRSSKTTTKYHFEAAEKKHGCIWWVCIGWWWAIIDFMLWVFMFLPRLIIRLFAAPFKRKKYDVKGSSVSQTKNRVTYKTVCVCQNCGKRWSR